MEKAASLPQEQGEVGPGKPPVHSRFKPGQSGNPGGRKKGISITAEINAILAEGLDVKPKPKRKKVRALAEAIFLAAMKGNARLAKEVWDRIDGKVAEKVEHTGKDGKPIAYRLEDMTDEQLLADAERILERSRPAGTESGCEGSEDPAGLSETLPA